MKCDISVTGKIGLFGSTFGHPTYQNIEYEACMLSTWSQGMSQNSYHHPQNDWWEGIVFFCLPNHVFQLAHFIGEIANNQEEIWPPIKRIFVMFTLRRSLMLTF